MAGKVFFALLIVAATLFVTVKSQASLGQDECPPKTGDVYYAGILGSITTTMASWLATEHVINTNSLKGKPSIPCFSFNLTLFDGGFPSDEVTCSDDEDYPYNDDYSISQSYRMGPCETICLPKNYLRYDTDCTASMGAPGAEALLGMRSDLIAVLGAGCSGPTMAAASYLLENSDIPIISGSATSAKLSVYDDFPNFFRTIPGDAGQSQALAEIAASFGIKKASIITTPDPYAGGFADGIEDAMGRLGIELGSKQVIGVDIVFSQEEAYGAMQALADDVKAGVTTIFITTHCQNAKMLKEIAIEFGLTSENCILWLGGDGNTGDTCVPDDVDKFIGMVGTAPRGGSGDVYKDFIGFWAQQEECAFPGQIHREGELELDTFATEFYDAVVALGIAIQRLIDAGMEVTGPNVIAEFEKDDFRFTGSTGIVSFGGDFIPPIGPHDRPPLYEIRAFEGQWDDVGYWSPLDLESVNFLKRFVLPGGSLSVPKCLTEG